MRNRERLHALVGPALALLLASPAAGAPGDLRWDRVVDRGPGAELPVHAVQSRDHVHLALLSTGDAGSGGWWLHTLDAATGALAWEDRDDTPGFDATLRLALGRGLLVAVGSRDDGMPRWLARAYDPASGALRWEDDASGREGAVVDAAVLGSRVVLLGHTAIGGAGARVSALRVLDARTGALLWERVDLPGQALRLVASGTNLFAWVSTPTRDLLVGHAISDGRELWGASATLPFAPLGSRRVASFFAVGRAVLASASVAGQVRVQLLDGRTGEPIWDWVSPALTVPGTDGELDVAPAGRALFAAAVVDPPAATAVSALYQLDARGGAPLGVDLLGSVTPHAAAGRGRVLWLAGSTPAGDDLVLQAIDTRTGATLFFDTYDDGGTEVGLGIDLSPRSILVTGVQTVGSDVSTIVRVYETR